MPIDKLKTIPFGGKGFAALNKAREILREKSVELVNDYINLAKLAAADGKYEVAEKIQWRLIEHIAAEDGSRIISASVDKPSDGDSRPTGPSINIGFQLGGFKSLDELPPAVIVEEFKDDE